MGIKVIFWGNSQSVFSNRHFELLEQIPCDVAGVVDTSRSDDQGSTNPMTAGQGTFVDLAEAKGITIMTPADPNDPYFVRKLQRISPDLFIAVGYDRILKPPLLAVPTCLAVNFHASLLPKYRGKHPVFWTLRGGERMAGLTVHVMDPGIDTGDIVYQVKVRTRRDDTVASLYSRIMDRSVPLIGRLLSDVERGAPPRCSQPAGEGSYFSSIEEEDYRVEWSQDAEKIRRSIVMTPGKCFSRIAGRRLYLHQAERGEVQGSETYGTIQALGRKRACITAGAGSLSLGLARLQGGREQSMASICRELSLGIGDRLG